MLEEEYQKRRVLPPHLRPAPVVQPEFSFTIRPAVEGDVPHIREIYNYYVTNSAVTFDDQQKSLAFWSAKMANLHKLGLPFLVAENPNGQILGYALCSPWIAKRGARFTVENSIYLRPGSTGKGLGPAMLSALIDAAKAAGLREMIAVISDGGAEASVALHARMGFKEVGRMGKVGFKFDRWLGTILMQRKLR